MKNDHETAAFKESLAKLLDSAQDYQSEAA